MRDLTGSIGGPINRDKLWFFVSGRTKRTEKKVPIMLYNKNAGTNAWLYEADPTPSGVQRFHARTRATSA